MGAQFGGASYVLAASTRQFPIMWFFAFQPDGRFMPACSPGRLDGIRREMQRIEWDFQIGHAVGFRRRQLAGPDIDLQCGQDECWGCQGCVADFAHGDELRLEDAIVDVNVFGTLLGDRAFPLWHPSMRGIVVAVEQASGPG